jgi:hypothetical protein
MGFKERLPTIHQHVEVDEESPRGVSRPDAGLEVDLRIKLPSRRVA